MRLHCKDCGCDMDMCDPQDVCAACESPNIGHGPRIALEIWGPKDELAAIRRFLVGECGMQEGPSTTLDMVRTLAYVATHATKTRQP